MSKKTPRNRPKTYTTPNKYSYSQDDPSLASGMSSRFSAGNLASLAEIEGSEEGGEGVVINENSEHGIESVHSKSSSASLWAPSSISAAQQQRNHHEYGSAGGGSSSMGASCSGTTTPNRTPSRTRRRRRQQQKNDHQQQQQKDSSSEQQQEGGRFLTRSLSNLASATGSTALGATMEILKFAGATTLSTTGKIIAPPLHVTRTVLLPALWEATVDAVSSATPQRAKDWFKIVSSSAKHVTQVLKDTPKGKAFRNKVATVGADVVDCVSSDASRQVLLDIMASTVKLSEALHTPEMKALLERLAVLGCRVVDAVSSGRNKRLLHDVTDTVWAGIEVLADPAATQALAEVTAYMCHALVMEDVVHRPLDGATAKSNRAQRRRDRNRFERRTYVEPTMIRNPKGTSEEANLSSLGVGDDDGGGGSIMNTSNGTTTRRVKPNQQKHHSSRDDGETGSLPSKVVYDKSNPLGVTEQSIHANSEPADPLQNIPGTGGDLYDNGNKNDKFKPLHNDERDWEEMVKEDAGMQYLEDRIKDRASLLKQQRFHRYSKRSATDGIRDVVDYNVLPLDIEDLNFQRDKNGKRNADGGKKPPQKSPIGLLVEQEHSSDQEVLDDDKLNTSHIHGSFEEFYVPIRDDDGGGIMGGDCLPQIEMDIGEAGGTAIQQFHQTLDEIMARKRKEAVKNVLSGRYNGNAKVKDDGIIIPSHEDLKAKSWYSNAAAATGAGNERGEDTIKYGITSIRKAMKSRATIGVGDKKEYAKDDKTKGEDRPSEGLVSVGQILTGIVVVLFLLVWFSFGCFGVYMYFSKSTIQKGDTILVQSSPQLPSSSPDLSSRLQPAPQEILIRIVKEVVHVDSSGQVIEKQEPDVEESEHANFVAENKDRITNCVADALN